MTYLSIPRIAFSGRFQSDVSTVNNDVRHYDNAGFKPRFQEPQASNTEMNGWWNPRGTGAFRLVDVSVCQLVSEGATAAPTNLYISAQVERTASKMVDLDPQFQMGSSLWGLRLVLTDGASDYMTGDYLAAPFRDLFFGRVNRGGGSGNASAKFTSVLENVTWGAAADALPALQALKAASEANENRLSVNLVTFGYIAAQNSKDFTYGNLVGSIGTWQAGSPKKFVQGRRFTPVLAQGPFSNASNIGFFDGSVSGNTVSIDVSNALPLSDISGAMTDLHALHLAILRTGDTVNGTTITPGVTEGSKVAMGDIIDLGPLPYQDEGWLTNTAGLADFTLSDAARDLVSDHPLALVTPDEASNTATVRIREAMAGLMVRADTMELRVDAQTGAQVTATTQLCASEYGKPVPDLPISLALNAPEKDQGNSGQTNPPNPSAPKAHTPIIGVPAKAVSFAGTGQTDASGRLDATLGFKDPKNPRGYIDGQIYKVNYQIAMTGTSDMPFLDLIVTHLRDAYDPPDAPDWATDIAPILTQYGNLYPIMSHGLFSFSDEAVVRKHARILIFALNRDLADPTHMPATRDLSEGKRTALLNWLNMVLGEAVPATAPAPAEYVAAAEAVPDMAPPIGGHAVHIKDMPDVVAEGFDGKTAAMREMITARLKAQSEDAPNGANGGGAS